MSLFPQYCNPKVFVLHKKYSQYAEARGRLEALEDRPGEFLTPTVVSLLYYIRYTAHMQMLLKGQKLCKRGPGEVLTSVV